MMSAKLRMQTSGAWDVSTENALTHIVVIIIIIIIIIVIIAENTRKHHHMIMIFHKCSRRGESETDKIRRKRRRKREWTRNTQRTRQIGKVTG